MRRLALPLALLPLGLLAACGGDPSGPGGPGGRAPAGTPVVLISIDTLRSDRLPAYGFRGVETPAIDALRRDALLCEQAWSHVPLTLPSHVSLLSGRLPTEHGVRDNQGYKVSATAGPWLPEELRRKGYATGGVVSSYVLRRATGIDRGFDAYDDQIASYFDHHNPTNFGNGGGTPGFGTGTGDAADGNRDGEVVAERSGGSGSKGNVLLNSEWSFNVNGLYQVAPDRPWGFNLGTNISGRQGYPNTLYRNITPNATTVPSVNDRTSRAVQVSGDVDSERLDDVFTIDLRLDKEINFGDFGATIGVDVFNILNDNTVLQRERNQGSARANFVNETVSPRIFRLGLRLHFR